MRLKPNQIDKLSNRESFTPEQRRDNEFAVRNRLKEFLEFLGDANFIIDHLPHDQLLKSTKLKPVLNDYTVQESFELVLSLLELLGYAPIFGPPDNAYTVIDRYRKMPIVRPATENDLDRNLMIRDYVSRLSEYYLSDSKRLAEHDLHRAKNIKWKEFKLSTIGPVVPHEIEPEEKEEPK
jgi:hypothetical protein